MKLKGIILILLGILGLAAVLNGCSAPSYSLRDSLNFYSSNKGVARDFKGNVIYKDRITDLKKKVEDYIAHHPEINEEAKSALKELKVIKGMTREQVKLLLGSPGKVQNLNSRNKFRASQRWVYAMRELRCIYVMPAPLFFTHDAHHLYFKGDILTGIEEVNISRP